MNCPNCGYLLPDGATTCVACGQPVRGQPADVPGSTPGTAGAGRSASPPGWLSRNAKWAIPTGCLTMLLLFGLFIAGVLAFVFSMFRSSEPYQQGLERARQNQQVVAALGTPIEPGWLMTGSINDSGATGEADFSLPIAGPKGKGTIYINARKAGGRWEFRVLVVELDNGTRIDLLNEGVEPPTTF